MNIIELAKEAGLGDWVHPNNTWYAELERFAALVREQAYREDKDLTIAYMVGYEKGKDACEALAEPVKQEPVAGLFLGGIADGEYGECEVDPYQRVIEALQEKLVKDGNAVRLELYAAPVDAKAIRAELEQVSNDLSDAMQLIQRMMKDKESIRAEALEEAFLVCQQVSLRYLDHYGPDECAAAIKRLK